MSDDSKRLAELAQEAIFLLKEVMMNKDDAKRLAELAQEAIFVQDACNLSGVIHSFSRTITELREILMRWDPDGFSTTTLNQHPICVLYSSKIASLTNSEDRFKFSYNWCKDLEDIRKVEQ